MWYIPLSVYTCMGVLTGMYEKKAKWERVPLSFFSMEQLSMTMEVTPILARERSLDIAK